MKLTIKRASKVCGWFAMALFACWSAADWLHDAWIYHDWKNAASLAAYLAVAFFVGDLALMFIEFARDAERHDL